ncbi:MAG TPA: DUF4388 domain-containing protein [Pyrinomonadaceae bacterium]
MALIGELSDLSLGELIEFFCNQRKTGRLEVVYPVGPGHFYLKSGAVVHAEFGELRGIEAIYFALTQANASFTFSTAFEPPEQTINQPWTSVVLEGLRRMDQGIPPPNPFPNGKPAVPAEKHILVPGASVEKQAVVPAAPAEKHFVVPAASVEKHSVAPAVSVARPQEAPRPQPAVVRAPTSPDVQAFGMLSLQADASKFQSRRFSTPAVVGAIVLLIAVVGVPWGWYARSKAKQAVSVPDKVVENTPVEPAPSTAEATASPLAETHENNLPATADAQAAKRLAEAKAKERARSLEQSASQATQDAPKTNPAPPKQSNGKNVTVTVTYDENGRVTGASGGDATALRIARQKRFPAGKPGSATVTIPIN